MIPHVFARLSLPSAVTRVPRTAVRSIPRYAVLQARPVRLLSSKVQLRGYQEECIQSILLSLQEGQKRLGVSLATGSGKTVIFTQLIQRVLPTSERATQTLIIAHRRELVEQAARHCQSTYPEATIDIEMGSLHASGIADITIASLQSITSKGRLQKFDPARFKLVLVDEAHHIVAPGYMRILKHFDLDAKKSHSPALVGVSATFSRFDGLKLGAAIDQIVYHKDYVDMIGEKWLSDVVFTTVESTADISWVKSGVNGDFQAGELSRVVNTDQINEITVRSWLARAQGRKSTLVFCVDLAHVAGLSQKFRRFGLDARFVTGDTPTIERSEILRAFRNGEFPVLVNCGVFTEGTDIPNIDCIILARPTRSRNLLVQMIGRGMRLHAGKTNCHIIDMVSSLETGIVTTPTLFGLDPGELLEKASMDDIKSSMERKDDETLRRQAAYSDTATSGSSPESMSISFTEYSSVYDLIEDTSGEKHIRSMSQYAWVRVGQDKYVLCAPNGSFIRLERIENQSDPSKPLFHAVEMRALPPEISKSPYAAPRELLQATTFADAVHGSDKYASEAFPHVFIHRYQSWRKKPPTQGQIDFLNKMRPKDEPLAEGEITKGQATDMITKIKHVSTSLFLLRLAKQTLTLFSLYHLINMTKHTTTSLHETEQYHAALLRGIYDRLELVHQRLENLEALMAMHMETSRRPMDKPERSNYSPEDSNLRTRNHDGHALHKLRINHAHLAQRLSRLPGCDTLKNAAGCFTHDMSSLFRDAFTGTEIIETGASLRPDQLEGSENLLQKIQNSVREGIADPLQCLLVDNSSDRTPDLSAPTDNETLNSSVLTTAGGDNSPPLSISPSSSDCNSEAISYSDWIDSDDSTPEERSSDQSPSCLRDRPVHRCKRKSALLRRKQCIVNSTGLNST
ncbi:putative mitochondrial ATP-dependent helicase irc3 like protein [Verticillium longisporum]|nr:putative mitochondrial ATP-dependent helicase irc3 like protein [Verticillium longisporum]